MTNAHEHARASRLSTILGGMAADVRFALRLFRRSAASTSLALLSLALGIGANTAVFSLIDTVLLKPLPVREPGRLVQVVHAGQTTTAESTNYRLFQAVRDAGAPIDGVLLARVTEAVVKIDGAAGTAGRAARTDASAPEPSGAATDTNAAAGLPERVTAQFVTGGYHETLGVRALIGRTLEPADSTDAGIQPVAVLGYDYWRARFAADPQVLGRSLLLDKTTYTIVGVTQPGFVGLQVGRRVEVTVPLDARTQEAGWYSMPLIARLAEGVSAAHAQAALQGAFTTVIAESGMGDAQRRNAFARLELTPASHGLGDLRRRFSLSLLVLFGVVGVVLLLACANVSSLQLARAHERARELGIRQALGAGRGRLIRQLLTESALLACAGGAAGVLLAWWATNFLIGFMPELSRVLVIEPDRRVLAFTLGVSLLAAVCVGILPAWLAARRDPQAAMAEGGRVVPGGTLQAGRRPLRAGRLLVIGQIALACVLLAGAVLFLQSLWNLRGVEGGFDDRGVLVASVDTRGVDRPDDQMAPVYRDVLARFAALSGLERATLATVPPMSCNVDGKPFGVLGLTAPAAGWPIVNVNTVAAGYFETFGVPLRRGRGVTAADRAGAPRVAVMSEALARLVFGDADPIGRTVGFGRDRTDPAAQWQIVGIARDVRDCDPRRAASPTVYVSYEQVAEPDRVLTFAIRARGTPAEWTARLRRELSQAAPAALLGEIQPLSRFEDDRLVRDRLLAALCGYFGLIALLLTGLGIYGLMAHAVTRRTPEIGVRMAFGATRWQLRWLVLRESLPPIACGLAAGLLAAVATTRLARALLFEVRPTDPMLMATALGFMATIAIVAVIVPAWRASRVDPLVALRAE